MKSIIEWKTGEPTEFGFYLTVRKSRIDGSMRVDFNQWAKDEIMTNGLPKGRPQGWQIKSPDACDIVAWFKFDDIVVEDLIDKNELLSNIFDWFDDALGLYDGKNNTSDTDKPLFIKTWKDKIMIKESDKPKRVMNMARASIGWYPDYTFNKESSNPNVEDTKKVVSELEEEALKEIYMQPLKFSSRKN